MISHTQAYAALSHMVGIDGDAWEVIFSYIAQQEKKDNNKAALLRPPTLTADEYETMKKRYQEENG